MRKCHQFNRSTQSAWKQCGARHARLNRVKCTVAERFAQSTSGFLSTLPQGIQGDRNPLGTPFSPIFRRATKDGATGGRRLSREVGKIVQSKDTPPEVASCRTRPVKTQNKTIAPPEAVSQAERPREFHALQVNSLTGPQDFISTSTSAGPEALPLPSFLTMTVTIPLSPLPVPLWK